MEPLTPSGIKASPPKAERVLDTTHLTEHTKQQVHDGIIEEPLNNFIEQIIKQSINQSDNQPTEHPIEQTVDQSIDLLIDQLIEQPVDTPPINQPTEQLIEHPVNQNTEQLIEQSVNTPIYQSTEQLIEQNNNLNTNTQQQIQDDEIYARRLYDMEIIGNMMETLPIPFQFMNMPLGGISMNNISTGNISTNNRSPYVFLNFQFGSDDDYIDNDYETLSGLDANKEYRGTPLNILEKFPMWEVSSGEITKENANKYMCCVCLEEICEKQIVRKLPCDHLYHKSCIDTWLEKSKQCPVDKYYVCE